VNGRANRLEPPALEPLEVAVGNHLREGRRRRQRIRRRGWGELGSQFPYFIPCNSMLYISPGGLSLK